ncbi:hypothetical protein P5673_024200 [Acropora cervicornis]|uniref:Uncharacterized protein n=1 Tax=Acropora cervicornis TaxID=6130 RepID=A0AAD9UY58_ACRCE|nr:hypothetical protein P5673_024200 [Acropora cervicornis]
MNHGPCNVWRISMPFNVCGFFKYTILNQTQLGFKQHVLCVFHFHTLSVFHDLLYSSADVFKITEWYVLVNSELLVPFEPEGTGAEQRYSANDKLEEQALEGAPTAAATSV